MVLDSDVFRLVGPNDRPVLGADASPPATGTHIQVNRGAPIVPCCDHRVVACWITFTIVCGITRVLNIWNKGNVYSSSPPKNCSGLRKIRLRNCSTFFPEILATK